MFNVTFVEKDSTLLGLSNKDKYDDRKIYYNCGDDKFQYVLSNYYNGPNFIMERQDDSCSNDTCEICPDGSCFFDFK